MTKHDGSNKKPCSTCNQRRGAWTSDWCTGSVKTSTEPMITTKQATYLTQLINNDYSQATTFGLHKVDVTKMTKIDASDAIDNMLNG